MFFWESILKRKKKQNYATYLNSQIFLTKGLNPVIPTNEIFLYDYPSYLSPNKLFHCLTWPINNKIHNKICYYGLISTNLEHTNNRCIMIVKRQFYRQFAGIPMKTNCIPIIVDYKYQGNVQLKFDFQIISLSWKTAFHLNLNLQIITLNINKFNIQYDLR